MPAAWLGVGNVSLSKLVTYYVGKRLSTSGSHHKLEVVLQKSLQEGQQVVRAERRVPLTCTTM